MNKALATKMQKLEKQFPSMWMKAGEEFSSGHENAIWTGEGSDIGSDRAFDYYGYRDTMGVHPRLARALDSLGLYAEFYDAGTVFFYVP
jgi:hypothetical protein